MDLLEEWQKLVTTSLKGQEFQFSKKLRDGTIVQPLYLNPSESLKFPATPRHFCNILPIESPAVTDEFVEKSRVGLFCSEMNSLQQYSGKSGIYLSPSLWLNNDHVDFIESQLETWSSTHLGWDLWTRGLYEGRLQTWDEKSFPLASPKVLENENVTIFRFSSEAYHLAGAHNVHELSILLATVVEALKSYPSDDNDHPLLSKMSFETALSSQPFESIAKLQAFHLLWEKLQQSLGVEACETRIYARPSLRYLSSREPWNNIMRLTLMNFAAQLGGACGFFHEPYDIYSVQPRDDAHIARNISLILEKESALQESSWPALGSGYIESLTEQYCEKSWSFFQEIQNKGGLLESLLSGWLQKEISISHEEEASQILAREKKMIGVNHFAGMTQLSEDYKIISESKNIETLWGERIGPIEGGKVHDVQPLRLVQLSSLFEAWQRKSDSYLAANGARPLVSIYCQDPKAFKERIQWLKSFLGAGGIQVQMTEQGKEPSTNLVFCLGYDPEEKEWSERLKQWQADRTKTAYWFGEKENSNFKNFIHQKSHPAEFYEKIYRIFSEAL